MSARLFLAASLAATMTFGAWLALRPPELAPIAEGVSTAPAGQAAAAREAARRAHGASSAASSSAAATPPRPQFKIAPAPPTLFNQYLGAKEYRILYDRLADSPQGRTPEGRLVLYEILRQCATITEGPRPGYRANPPKREDFLNRLPPADPQRERRIAAYDAFATDRCKGFEGTMVKHAELLQLLNEAAAGGNPQAQALAMEQALWQARRSGGATLSDTQVASLQEILRTRDPEAIRVAGRILGNSWNDYSLRIGPDQLPVEPRAFVNAFLVLSCEYGAPCGSDTPRMLEACAMRGHCNAQNFPEHLYYYGSTPHDANMLMQYREIVRNAIETGNWSQLTVVRGVSPGGNRMTFVPGPR